MFLIFLCTSSVPKQRTTKMIRISHGAFRPFRPALHSANVCWLPANHLSVQTVGSCALGSRTGSDRTVGRNHRSATPSSSLAPVHSHGKSPWSPSEQGAGWSQNWYADAGEEVDLEDSSLLGVD